MNARFLTLLACFFLSGFAALLYQTAWSRELSFVFGTSDLAVAAVLAAYMGGLALGSAVAARFAHRVRRPVLVYGVLEGAIALCALAVPWAIRGLDTLYVGMLGGREVLESGLPAAATAFQLGAAFAILLPPTAFMGATLPLLARYAVQREEEISTRIGLLYAINTVGAIGGTVCAAFALMPELGLRLTVYVGAAINFVVFGLAALSARGGGVPVDERGAQRGEVAAPGSSWVLPAILISGVVSFGYEVMWTRLLGHQLGASLQAFATMLASFLTGIALGSAVASRVGRSRERAKIGFALAQLGIAATSYAAFALAEKLPGFSAALGAGPGEPLASAAVAAAALLPITLCIGTTFPFAVRILAAGPEQASAATARVYAWNTVGAIVGSLGTGFLALPELGFEGTMAIGVATSLALAAWAAVACTRWRPALLGAAALGGAGLVAFPAAPPLDLISTTSFTRGKLDREIVFAEVGRSATVVVAQKGSQYFLTTNGLPEAAASALGVPTQASLAHWLGALPAFLRPESREVVVIGMGGAVALELLPQSYDTIHVIELEPEVVAANRAIADKRDRNPLADPRIQVHIGDARGTLQLTSRRFDAIVSQPSHPWTAGASHLYTREFFEQVRSRLVEDGIFVQWIGLQFVDEELLRSLLAALTEAFPSVQVFAPRPHGLLFAASKTPIEPLAAARRAFELAPDDLARLGVDRIEDFASRWWLDDAGARQFAEGVVATTDDHNLLASRSAALRDKALKPLSLSQLLLPHDVLRGLDADLDSSALVRAMLHSGQAQRAAAYVGGLEVAERATGRGWIELKKGRNGVALRHFERALASNPDSDEAFAGLFMSQVRALAADRPTKGLEGRDLGPQRRALAEGWRAARNEEWSGLRAVDEALGEIRPGDPPFEAATRLRMRWRVEVGDPAEAAEAMDLARMLLLRRWLPGDALLYARAALRAGEVEVATRELRDVARQAMTRRGGERRQTQTIAQRLLEIARELPPERYAEFRGLIKGGTGRAPGRAVKAPREADAATPEGTAAASPSTTPAAPDGTP